MLSIVGIIRFTIKAQSSIRDSSSPSPSPPPQTSSSTLGPFIGEVAGALLSAMITVTAVAILIGILVCYKRRVKATIANETHYFVAELSTIVSSIQTSTNTAYGTQITRIAI